MLGLLSLGRRDFDALSDIVRGIQVDVCVFLILQEVVHLGETLEPLRKMPHVEGVLSSQLFAREAPYLSTACAEFSHVPPLMLTWALEALESPFALQLLLLLAQVPQERQVVRKVTRQLRVA